MTIDFQSGFETGNTSEWDTVLTSGFGEAFNVGTGFAHWGNYGAEVSTNGDLLAEYAFVRHYCNYDDFYARMYVYNDWESGWDNDERVAFFWVVNDAGLNIIFEVGIAKITGQYRWYLQYYHNGAPVLRTDYIGSIPNPDRWYCVEVYYKQESGAGADDGRITVWIDGGNWIYDIPNVGNVELGNARAADFGVMITGTFGVALIEDDFAISGDARIGCAGSPSLYTDQVSCEAVGYYWCGDGICYSSMPNYVGRYCPLCANSMNRLRAGNSCPVHGILCPFDFPDYGDCSICGRKLDRFGQCKYVTTHCEAITGGSCN